MNLLLKYLSKLFLLLSFFCFVQGYVDVEMQYLKQLNEPTYIDYTSLKVKKVNGTRKLFGNATYTVPFDNTFLSEVLAYIKQGGEYRLLPYKLPKKGYCDLFNDDKFFYPDVVAVSDFPMPLPCPMTPGRYEIRGYELSFKNVPLSLMKSGDYAYELNFSKGGQLYLKFRIYASIISI